ncbi:hypothetical protein ACTWJ9_18115 [Streptomyces sp. GDS52]
MPTIMEITRHTRISRTHRHVKGGPTSPGTRRAARARRRHRVL